MTRNEILEWANMFYTNGGVTEREIAFARFMMSQEREACAKVCEAQITNINPVGDIAREDCAEAIRARGENK